MSNPTDMLRSPSQYTPVLPDADLPPDRKQRVGWDDRSWSISIPESQPNSLETKLEGDLRMIGRSRHGWRSQTSFASQTSASSGLREHFSSSSEESVQVSSSKTPAWKHHLAGAETSESARSSALNHLRRPILKRRAKNLFLRLTAETDASNKESSCQKRVDYAKSLIDIIDNHPEGEDIVARRFTKTLGRQKAGLKALLRLSDDELRLASRGNDSNHLDDNASSQLLKLLIEHSKYMSLFQTTLPEVLEEVTYGIAGLRFIATQDREAVALIEPFVLANFLRGTLRDAKVGSSRWIHGASFLEFMLRPMWQPSAPTNDLVDVVFEELVPIFDPAKDCRALFRSKNEEAFARVVVLRAIYSSCIALMRDRSGSPDDRIPSYLPESLFTLPSLDDVTGDQARVMTTSLAIVSTMFAFPSVAARMVEDGTDANVKDIAYVCVQVLLGSTKWQFRSKIGGDVEGFPRLRPEDDALDILRRLPAPAFENALNQAVESEAKQLGGDKLNSVSRLLSLLLWISLKSMQLPEVHRALVRSDTSRFLLRILEMKVPEESSYLYRDICRAKGDALTVLGNLCEVIGVEDLQEVMSADIINATQSIRDSTYMPTVQIGQAAFTILRYSEACKRCGLDPRV